MMVRGLEGRAPEKVDPAFIAGVIFLRRACSVNDMATILGCGRKRVLTVLARLGKLGVPVGKDPTAPRYRPLTLGQREDVATLYNNGDGLDFYGLCRVMHNVHPLAILVFLRNGLNPRAWWVRRCAACGRPFATPQPAIRFCSCEHGLGRRVLVSA
ncbi:MAG: hypothetical protein ACREKS_00175 [Candidatus Rokuibacteriota bacterium]